MAYRVIRMKKEARRNTKLDEIFQVSHYITSPVFSQLTRFLIPKFESLRLTRILIQKKDGADGSLDGTITREELEEIYEMYEVRKKNFLEIIQIFFYLRM